MKLIILPLSAYVNTNQSRSIDAFARLGVSKTSMLFQWFALPGPLGKAIDWMRGGPSLTYYFEQFNLGKLSIEAFRAELRKKFRPLLNKSDEEIDAAWNAMCTVTDFTKNAFDESNSLLHYDKDGYQIIYTSNTNPLHATSISAQYNKAIPGETVFSFNKGVNGIKLLEALIKEKRQNHPELSAEDILFIYAPPPAMPYPKLDLLSWLIAPFQSWAAHNGQKYVSNLQKLSKGNFTLVPNQATATEPNIHKLALEYKLAPTHSETDTYNLMRTAGFAYTPIASATSSAVTNFMNLPTNTSALNATIPPTYPKLH